MMKCFIFSKLYNSYIKTKAIIDENKLDDRIEIII